MELSAVNRIEIETPLGRELRVLIGGPFQKRLDAAKAGGSPAELHEWRVVGVHLDRRRGCGGMGSGQFEFPTILIQSGIARPCQGPVAGLVQIIGPPAGSGGVFEGVMPAEPAAALAVERKRPAQLMSDAVVLMGRHVAVGINNPAAEGLVPIRAHGVSQAVGGHRRPRARASATIHPRASPWVRSRDSAAKTGRARSAISGSCPGTWKRGKSAGGADKVEIAGRISARLAAKNARWFII